VFHLAAKTSVNESFQLAEAYRTINAQATDTLLYQSAKVGVKRVVISSTCAVYGEIGTVAASESLLTQPKSPYAVTKLQNELAAEFYAQTMGLETIALRYFNAYGSRQKAESQYSSVLSKFIASYQAKMSPLVFGNGLQTRDFIHVSDIVQANLLAAKATINPNTPNPTVLNIGTGHAITVLALLHAVSDAFGYTLPVTFNAARQGDIRHSVASITAAQSVLGFAPNVTVDAGIRGLVEEALKHSESSLPVNPPGVLSASGL
jgi:UDP-glucose 4-epimerase